MWRALMAAVPVSALVAALATCTAESRAADRDLPDSVLAVVGTRVISRAQLQHEQALAAEEGRASSPAVLLEQLVDRAVLRQAALAENPNWTPSDSASFRTLRDRLLIGTALEAALDEARRDAGARGDTAPSPESIGVAAREAAVSRAQVNADEALLARLAAAWAALPQPSPDSTVASQLRTLAVLPKVAPDDTARAVLRSLVGEVRVTDLLAAWRRLTPALRPRIETTSQMRDLAHNALFERALRREAEVRGLERTPAIAATLDDTRERNALSRYLDREVFETLAVDSLALRRRYEADPSAWALPRRVRALRFDFAQRNEASAMGARLVRPTEAESLEARAQRSGISYRVEVSAGDDAGFVERAERAGARGLVGPEKGRDGWWVAWVEAFLPTRPRSFDEARADIERRWLAEEGDRRTRVLCERLRKRADVRLNRRAFERQSVPTR